MAVKIILRNNEKINKALRRFKRRCEKEDIFKELQRNAYFEKPCEDRRRHARKIEKEKKRREREKEWERQHGIL